MNLAIIDNRSTIFLATPEKARSIQTADQIIEQLDLRETITIVYGTEEERKCQEVELHHLIEKLKAKMAIPSIVLEKCFMAKGESIDSMTRCFNVIWPHWMWFGSYDEKTKTRPYVAWEEIA